MSARIGSHIQKPLRQEAYYIDGLELVLKQKHFFRFRKKQK
jgi:hypothetical protein